jgi:hypothetical protein
MDYWIDNHSHWHVADCAGTDECESCGGDGWDDGDGDACGDCDGAGTVPCSGCY